MTWESNTNPSQTSLAINGRQMSINSIDNNVSDVVDLKMWTMLGCGSFIADSLAC